MQKPENLKVGDRVLINSCREKISQFIGKHGVITNLSKVKNLYVKIDGSKQDYLFYKSDLVKD